MPITIYDTNQLVAVVPNLKKPTTALLDRYYPRVVQFETKKVSLDKVTRKRRIAPWVSPKVEGVVLTKEGFRTEVIEPGYLKPKMEFEPADNFERVAGEAIAGNLTPQQRHDINVALGLETLTDSIWRRKELMASDLLVAGKLTIKGEKYPEQVVDFERHADLLPAALAGGDRWTESTAKPKKQFNAAARTMVKHAGFGIVDAIMGYEAWDAFANNAQVAADLVSVVPQGMAFAPEVAVREGLQLQGRWQNVNIWTYTGLYDDPDTGTTTEIFPAKKVAFTSPLFGGIRLYGAIHDGKAGYRAMPIFPKMYEEDDPAIVWLMCQSAPMLACEEVNGAYVIQVVD
jgi:hypothetical protein